MFRVAAALAEERRPIDPMSRTPPFSPLRRRADSASAPIGAASRVPGDGCTEVRAKRPGTLFSRCSTSVLSGAAYLLGTSMRLRVLAEPQGDVQRSARRGTQRAPRIVTSKSHTVSSRRLSRRVYTRRHKTRMSVKRGDSFRRRRWPSRRPAPGLQGADDRVRSCEVRPYARGATPEQFLVDADHLVGDLQRDLVVARGMLQDVGHLTYPIEFLWGGWTRAPRRNPKNETNGTRQHISMDAEPAVRLIDAATTFGGERQAGRSDPLTRSTGTPRPNRRPEGPSTQLPKNTALRREREIRVRDHHGGYPSELRRDSRGGASRVSWAGKAQAERSTAPAGAHAARAGRSRRRRLRDGHRAASGAHGSGHARTASRVVLRRLRVRGAVH